MTEIAVDLDISRFLIGGQLVAPTSGLTWDMYSASTEAFVATAPIAGLREAELALRAARNAFDNGPWTQMTPTARAEFVARIGRGLEAVLEDAALGLTAEIGKPISASRGTARVAATLASFWSDYGNSLEVSEARPATGGVAHVIKEPVGVVLAIVPWNGTYTLAMNKLAPALIAGCTVVVKMPEESPYSTAYLRDVVHAVGLPPGVVNIVPADRVVGDYMLHSLLIDKVSFTGSTAVGQHIVEVSAKRMLRLSLELGGKSAAIVLDDADLETTVPELVRNSLVSSGQICRSLTRYVVSERRHDELVDAMAKAFATVKTGDPFDPDTLVGPLASAARRDSVERYVHQARAEGARVAIGGGRPSHLDRGWYVAPTILAGVRPGSTVAQEEIFGPVVSVIAYRDEDEAIAIANNSAYGLSGAVFTSDQERGMAIARQVRVGTFNVSKIGVSVFQPFGGCKMSGYGREGGVEGIDDYFELKQVFVANA